MRTIIAIQANTNPTKWVSGIFNRVGNSIRVELTDDKNLAHDFLTEAKANEVLPNIYNPFDRVFKVKTMKVVQPETMEAEPKGKLK